MLGSVRVRDFTRGHAKAFLLAMRERKPAFSAATLRIIYATLRSVLNSALDDELIPANPVLKLGKLMTRPSDGEDVVKAFEAEQLRVFLATAERESALHRCTWPVPTPGCGSASCAAGTSRAYTLQSAERPWRVVSVASARCSTRSRLRRRPDGSGPWTCRPRS